MSSKKKTIAIAITIIALFASSAGMSQASQNSGTASTHGYANSMGSNSDHQKILVSVLAVLGVTAEVNAVGDKKGGHHKGDRIGHTDNN